MAIDARLRAQVMDAEMPIWIPKFTEVIAEHGPGPRDVTILWSYGLATAQAVIDRSFIQTS